jgi:hypothetical protein
MKNCFFIILFSILSLTKAKSQNPDAVISHALREVQIQLAKEYSKELTRSIPKFTEYAVVNTIFYEATKARTSDSSSFSFDFPSNPCIFKWGPLKLARCLEKINLLRTVNRLVRDIPVTSTSYSPKSAVQSNVMVKTNSILRDINTELLKH